MPFISRNPREIVEHSLRRVTTQQVDDDTVRNLQAEINWCKISLIAPEDYERVCAAIHHQPPAGLEPSQFVDIYRAYETEKTNRNEIDFDDILLITCHLIESDEDVAANIRSGITWLTVDEYQDVSPLQHRLLTRWLGDNRNICVVGDPAQTIYSFAGASSYNLLNFASEFGPLTADVRLNNDYRSTPQIVNYANRVLEVSPQRADYLKLNSKRDQGRRVAQTVYNSDLEEARGVAARIRRLVDEGASPGDCAILTRVNAQQKILCRALGEQHLRYRVKRDSGWQNSGLADDAQTRLAMLEALGAGGDVKGVTISTIHASKGLEFKHVFLIGCSEGLIPYGSPPEGDLLEEERRLMYVAVTRAEDTLDVSYARAREDDGSDRGRRNHASSGDCGSPEAFVSPASSVPSASFVLSASSPLCSSLVEQLGQFGIPIDAVRNILLRRGLFRTGSGGCGAVLFVGAILGLLVRQLRQQIRMRPFRVARLGAFLRADAFPQRGRLTHALGAQLHAHQAFERAFRRASDGAFAAQHLTKLFDMRNMRHARTPHDGIHPALHQGKQILQRLHGLLLLRSVRERHLGDVHRAGHGIRIDGLRLTDLLLHGIHVDGDATRVFAQQRLEAGH